MSGVRAYSGERLEYPQLGFAFALGALAFEQSGRCLPCDMVELKGSVKHQSCAFFGIGGTQYGNAEKKVEADNRSLQSLAPHAALGQIMRAPFEDDGLMKWRCGEASALLE